VRGLVVLPVLLAGCGSLDAHQLPPPATPAPAVPLTAAPAGRVVAGGLPPRDGRRVVLAGGRVAVLRARARVLELRAGRRTLATAGAGVGPAAVAADPAGRWLYVTDTAGGALLVFALRPKLELVHRVYLPGAPYAIAARGDRLWVTLTARNQLAELNVRRRPQRLRTLPAIRRPTAVAADARGVAVAGAGRLELITPPR
jgi:DNA-binding beta-propeller fold protein YncE